MYIMLAQEQPELLKMIASGPFLLYELEKMEKYNELSKITPQQKYLTDKERWTGWLTSYKSRLSKEIEDQTDVSALQKRRVQLLNSHNPKFVLRNYIAQNCIQKAEKGDYSEVRRVLKLLEDPYGEGKGFEDEHYDTLPPDWSCDLCVTCSS